VPCADPAVARRIRTEEDLAEREQEEKEMRELHSGAAISGGWRELNQPASTRIGQAIPVRTAARFRG
jgi:hypothetical protein